MSFRSLACAHHLLFLLVGLSFGPLVVAATPPGISVLDPIDLSPGHDVYEPSELAGNDTTHRLYVIGFEPAPNSFPSTSATPTFGVKVIDTTSNTVIAGVDLGAYHFDSYDFAFTPIAIATDSSSTIGGNRIYVSGRAGSSSLRVLDGATNTNLTGQGSDIAIPEGGDQLAANPNNHKVYLVNFEGTVTVVDGPGKKVLKTISTHLGLYSFAITVNPEANKVFVFGPTGILMIDSGDETYTTLDSTYVPEAATFDPATGKIFLLARDGNGVDVALYAFDGATGELLQSQTDVPTGSGALAVDSAAGRLFIAQPVNTYAKTTGIIETFTTDTLISFPGDSINSVGAARLTFLGSGDGGRLYFSNWDTANFNPVIDYYDMLGVLTPITGQIKKVTVGYSPSAIAVNPIVNRIYIADNHAPELTVLDGATGLVLDRVTTAPAANDLPFSLQFPTRSLAVSAALNRVYLSRTEKDESGSFATAYVDVYDGETYFAPTSLAIDIDPYPPYPRIAIDDTRKRLYFTGYSSTTSPSHSIKFYDLFTQEFLATVPVSSGLNLAVNAVTGSVYAPGFEEVEVIAPDNFQVSDIAVSGGGTLGPLTTDPLTNHIFVTKTGDVLGNEVAVLDGASMTEEATIDNIDTHKNDAVTDVAVDLAANRVFLCDNSSHEEATGYITVYDGNNSYAYLGEVAVGRYPERIAFNTTTRQLLVPNTQDGTISVLHSDIAVPPDRLANISTRLGVATGEDVLIGGFIVTGPAGTSKQVLIRGLGPSLTQQGVTGALIDPYLELHAGATILSTNDNWKVAADGSSQQAAIEATTIPPSDDLESAILITLEPGNYTAILRGADGGAGVGLVEIYDLTPSTVTLLANMSTRGRVEGGENVMIGGLIVGGSGPSQVLLRALGPSLSDAGVEDALQDPIMELHDAQGLIVQTNDDWPDLDFTRIVQTGIAPRDHRESAILATLYPANYTAIIRGKDDSAGVGLVEAYFLTQDN